MRVARIYFRNVADNDWLLRVTDTVRETVASTRHDTLVEAIDNAHAASPVRITVSNAEHDMQPSTVLLDTRRPLG